MTRRVRVDALENRDGTAVTGDVFAFDDAHADGGQWQAPGAGSASAAWPVGSIFLSAVSTNPATLLGFGTWSAIGAGRVLVGIDSGDVDFDTLGETGGAKTSSHSHTSGTLTTDVITSHAHGAGTLAPSAHSGTAVGNHTWDGDLLHQHFSGTIAVANHSSHTHAVGTLAVSNHRHEMKEVFSHGHSIAAGQGSHQHGMAEGTTDGSGTFMDRSNAAAATTAVTDLATLPAMTADNSGTSPAYTDYTTPTLSGSTASESATLSHSVSGNTGNITSTEDPIVHSVTQPDAHTMTGSTATGGAHGHNVNAGSTGSTASSTVQPYLVVAMWQRTA